LLLKDQSPASIRPQLKHVVATQLLVFAVMGDADTAPAAGPSAEVAQINGHNLHIVLFKNVSNAP
jgi:hypothetical protein